MVEKGNKVNKPRPQESNVIGQTRRRVNKVDNRDHVKIMRLVKPDGRSRGPIYVKRTQLAEAEHVKQQKNVIGAKAHPVSVAIYERKGLLGNIVCGELHVLSSTDDQSRNNIENVYKNCIKKTKGERKGLVKNNVCGPL